MEAETVKEPEHLYRTQGVCARAIMFDLDEEQHIHNLMFYGGCNGNLQGISSMLEDMPAQWAIERIEGTRCGNKPTSCPDQLAKALREALDKA